MLALGIAALVVVFFLATLRAASWAARDYLLLVSVYAALTAVGLVLYHRRKLAHLRAETADSAAMFRRVNRMTTWPTWCR